jgi:linoleate 10R-lipoxygenase
MTRCLADLFQFDLETEENPNGEYDTNSLYSDLLDIRIWGFEDDDPAQSWNRRRKAQVAMRRLLASTETYLKNVYPSGPIRNIIHAVTSGGASHSNRGSLRSFGRDQALKMLASGKGIEEIAETMVFSALGGVGSAISTVNDPENHNSCEQCC